jgi:hypothetical protein
VRSGGAKRLVPWMTTCENVSNRMSDGRRTYLLVLNIVI